MDRTGLILQQLLDKAYHDPSLRQKLLETRCQPDPMAAFCQAACEAGCPLTVG